MNDDELDNSIERQSFVKDEENPFLILGFLEFAIIATLTIVFFVLTSHLPSQVSLD